MKKAIISVIVPIYNVGLYLEKCIESIINQLYSDLDIILVDDGSTDNSGDICDYYATRDDRIRVIHKENKGLVVARKTGLELAVGEYISFVDGDDWIAPEMYLDMVTICNDNNADFVESGYFYARGNEESLFVCEDKVILLDDYSRIQTIQAWMRCPEKAMIRSTIWSKLYRAKVIKDSYLNIDDARGFGEDYINYLYLIKNAKKAVVISNMYYHYIYRNSSLSRDASINRLWDSCALFCKCGEIIRELYPTIDENIINTWFVQHTVKKFYSLNLDKDVPTPVYKICDIEDLRGKRIVIYGAGNVGKDIYIQLCKYADIDIVEWVDKNWERYNYSYRNIHSPSALLNVEYDIVLIAALRKKVAESIKCDISNLGCDENKIVWKEVGNVGDNLLPQPVGYNIVKVMGGLGNQMFQYAFYRALEEEGHKVVINNDTITGDTRSYELEKVFSKVKVKYDEEHKYESFKNSMSFHEFYQEPEHSVYYPEVFNKRDCSLLGYWQSERYFKRIEKIIRKEFAFFPEEEALIQLGNRIKQEANSVSIHIRRGDYLNVPEVYCGICTLDYYNKAINYISERIISPRYYVFSDDMDWVKSNFELENAVFVDKEMFANYRDWYDMYLMSCCHHNIIANSSFSWWGAWLNPNEDKVVVSPSKWVNGEDTRDIWCDSWVKIESEE